jgi:hypothetical protein
MRNLEAIFLAIKAVYEGHLDVTADLARLDSLLAEASGMTDHLRSRTAGAADREE